MSTLLIEKDLRNSKGDSEVQTLARARTATVIQRLDSDGNRNVIRFLDEAGLTKVGQSSINLLAGLDLQGAHLEDVALVGTDLHEANLQGANLHMASLKNADLKNANLTNANLKNADLSGASLKNATLSGAQGATGEPLEEKLEKQTESLKGAIMPGGSKHP
jgi:uncharacterized protein YjbI with pentapeptide repeats